MTPETSGKDDTRTRLIQTAALLFRQRGYNGVGLKELLDAASAPKGSLYHHFPDGKSDLALAAATWASNEMRRVIDDSFAPASDFTAGAQTLCHKLAKLFDITGCRDGCPISGILLENTEDKAFQTKAQDLYAAWYKDVENHALRFGLPQDDATKKTEHLFLLLQGAWTLARTRKDSDIIRGLTRHL